MAFGRKPENGPPPQVPAAPIGAPLDYAPRSRRIAEEAQRAAQSVIDLETDLREVTRDRDNIRAAFEAIKHDNDRLEARIAKLTREYDERVAKLTEDRDLYKHRVADIEARFDDAASLLLKVIDRRLTTPKVPVSMDRLEQDLKDEGYGHTPNSP